MAAILTRWSANGEARWWTWRHTQRQLGDGRITSLHPTEAFVAQNPDAGLNDLSTAMLLEWKNVRLLLGADVENPHWEQISREFHRIGDHSGMKVPHHGSHESVGSRGALHASFLEGSKLRFWVVTPYNKGKGRPGMEDGQGVHQLINHVNCLHLTGLPERHDRQEDSPCVTTRAECKQGIRPKPIRVEFAGGITGTALAENDGFKCWVGAVFSGDGTCEELLHGPGSIQMTE